MQNENKNGKNAPSRGAESAVFEIRHKKNNKNKNKNNNNNNF